jgi:cytochrome b561
MAAINPVKAVRYHAVARVLHWLIGLAIIMEIVIGLGHESWEGATWVMPVHKAAGITILMLSVLRLAWRLTYAAPDLPATMPPWQAKLAHGLHWLFYVMIIAVPVTGWVMSSAGKYPLNWFGLFDIPKLPVIPKSPLADFSHEAHEVMGIAFIPLLALHIDAAFYHHFSVGDGVLRRMF